MLCCSLMDSNGSNWNRRLWRKTRLAGRICLSACSAEGRIGGFDAFCKATGMLFGTSAVLDTAGQLMGHNPGSFVECNNLLPPVLR